MVSARRDIVLTLPLCAMGLILVSAAATAQQKFTIKSVAEKKLARLPAGPLYWRIETFPTLARAEAAAGPAALAAEVAGKVWLFTLGPEGGSTPGGSEVALIGPVPLFSATEYLLRINHASGPPGARTPVHNHPGSETFYLLTGQLTQKTPQGVAHVEAGHAMLGHPPGTTMEVSSTGTSDLSALVMFLADATKPFSVPAGFQ